MLALADEDRINVVLILADDLGVEAVSTYGGEHETPHLDSIARHGVKFDHGYATPICAPTRVRLMTGKYSYRNYEEFGFLGKEERTFAHAFQDAGYVTGIAGKWQLGGLGELEGSGANPAEAGFDEYLVWHFNSTNRGSRYWEPHLIGSSKINGDSAALSSGEHAFGPDILNAFVVDFIKRHQEEAFFLYYSMVLPHPPFVDVPQAASAKDDQKKFGAMVGYMDLMLGHVLAELEALDLTRRTFVIFIGDNGTSHRITSGRRDGAQIQGAKGRTVQASMHVPFLAQWPGRLPAGLVIDGLAEVLDIFPTIVEAAGLDSERNDLDGVSLLSVMVGESASVRDSVYMDYDPRWRSLVPARYAFNERYKLYDDGRLFDYSADPQEERTILPQDDSEASRDARSVLADVIVKHARPD
jgi:arylsulfatase A